MGKVSLDRSDINIQTLSPLDHLLHISAPASLRRLTAANLEAGGREAGGHYARRRTHFLPRIPDQILGRFR